MSYEANLKTFTDEAGQDLSSSQYYFMTIATDGQVDPTGDGALAHGVLQNKPDAAGKEATLAGPGSVTKVVAGGTISAGQSVASDASGNAVAASSNDTILGFALESAVNNDVFPMFFHPMGEYFA